MSITLTIGDNSGYDKGTLIGILKTAIKIESQAKALCPVDTGNLRNSISSELLTDSAIVGTNNEYAVYQEFGTKKMAAQPFLRPAAAIAYGQSARDVAESLNIEMRKTLRNKIRKTI